MGGLALSVSELRYLIAVADLRHFGHAAERCHVTQPSLSGQLRRLEETLGVSLIERTTRFVALTPLGERIVAHARRIVEEADQIAHLTRHRHGTLTSDLRLGVIPPLGPYILPRFVNALHQSFPDLHLVLREDLMANLLAALEAYALDAVLIALPEHDGAGPVMPLFVEPFWLVCPAAHRFSRQPVITGRDLARERLLLLDEGHCLRDHALAVCGNQLHDRTTTRDDFRATSLETICEMVAAGFGCTLLPAMAVPRLAARDERLAVRPVRAPQAHRRIGLVWRDSFPRSEDLQVLGRYIRDQLPDCVTPIRAKTATTKRDRVMQRNVRALP
jgi:LysR family transcriptional regulator, hydrogen peroxide-inducible genes activator